MISAPYECNNNKMTRTIIRFGLLDLNMRIESSEEDVESCICLKQEETKGRCV